MTATDELRQQAAQLGCALTAEQAERLQDYLALLQKWNRVHNLTAIRQPGEMQILHLLDSLAVARWIEVPRLLDVGSGGGLPGIPLAVVRPDMQVTLVDSHGKKASFLRQAVIELELGNVVVRAQRVETLPPEMRYEGIVARAFAEAGQLVGLTRGLLAPGGRWYVMKGVYPADELERLAGARLDAAHRLEVPGLRAERHLLILKDSDEQNTGNH